MVKILQNDTSPEKILAAAKKVFLSCMSSKKVDSLVVEGFVV